MKWLRSSPAHMAMQRRWKEPSADSRHPESDPVKSDSLKETSWRLSLRRKSILSWPDERTNISQELKASFQVVRSDAEESQEDAGKGSAMPIQIEKPASPSQEAQAEVGKAQEEKGEEDGGNLSRPAAGIPSSGFSPGLSKSRHKLSFCRSVAITGFGQFLPAKTGKNRHKLKTL